MPTSNRKKGHKMRNLKILGLVLVAMIVVGASVASADELTAEQEKVFLHGTYEPNFAGSLVITSGNSTCKEVTYDIGTVTTPTTTVTVKPTYPEKAADGTQNCLSGGFPAIVHVNGCHYVFHITGGTSTVGDVTLQCPAGQEITETTIAAGTIKCTIHIPSQTLTGDPVTYSTKGAGTTREVTASINAHGISYKHTEGTGVGKCTGGSGTNGTFVAKGTVTANNDPNTAHVGLFLSNS